MNNALAVVIVPAHPDLSTPTPVPAPVAGCAVQEQVGYNPAVFQCYTQEQWDAKQAQKAQQAAIQQQRDAEDWNATVSWPYWPFVGVFVLALIVWRIVYVLKHPTDAWGNRI